MHDAKTRTETDTLWCAAKRRYVTVSFRVTGWPPYTRRSAVIDCPAMADPGADCERGCLRQANLGILTSLVQM